MNLNMISQAKFSECRTFRYGLYRTWEMEKKPLIVIGLNPSTADETKDDPTIRRCMRYAKDWGLGGLVMLNIFAYRSTDPKGLRQVEDPIGPDNDWYLTQTRGGIMLCAWGANGGLNGRDKEVIELLANKELYVRA